VVDALKTEPRLHIFAHRCGDEDGVLDAERREVALVILRFEPGRVHQLMADVDAKGSRAAHVGRDAGVDHPRFEAPHLLLVVLFAHGTVV